MQKVGVNKLTPCLNANKLIYETVICERNAISNSDRLKPIASGNISCFKIISVHKLCDFDVQIKMRSGYKFILKWSNATESTG